MPVLSKEANIIIKIHTINNKKVELLSTIDHTTNENGKEIQEMNLLMYDTEKQYYDLFIKNAH